MKNNINFLKMTKKIGEGRPWRTAAAARVTDFSWVPFFSKKLSVTNFIIYRVLIFSHTVRADFWNINTKRITFVQQWWAFRVFVGIAYLVQQCPIAVLVRVFWPNWPPRGPYRRPHPVEVQL
mgnify:CR=1 FL=1